MMSIDPTTLAGVLRSVPTAEGRAQRHIWAADPTERIAGYGRVSCGRAVSPGTSRHPFWWLAG